ncbi:MAG: hypothetical protein QNJ68_07850 [Microcoleaceae cyanobacterium MO_207.B10]|nr:hypothetical protein [Microcoleaceae cyanobacterium MO_207.B10]
MKKISIEIELITPEKAKEYLATRDTNKYTAFLKQSLVEMYAKDMRLGLWGIGDPIKFNTLDELIDGQHRLEAVLQFGKPVKFYVVRNMLPECEGYIDLGVRTPAVVAKIRRLPITTASMATVKAMFTKRQPISTPLLIQMYEQHQEAVEFSANIKGLTRFKPIVRAVISRAFYHVDREILERFIIFLNGNIYTGKYEVEEVKKGSAALILREHLITPSTRADKIYFKAEYALDHFLEGKSISKLGLAKKELFPVPDFD